MNFLKKHSAHCSLIGWLLAFAALFAWFKHDYVSTRFAFFLGLALAPFIVRKTSPERSLRFAWLALAFGSVLFFERSNMAWYFCAGFGLLFLLESGWGRLNNLPVFLWAVMSPVFQYVADVWSFPIRLKMSELACVVLRQIGSPATSEGNIIMLNGTEFAVDPGCMGLNLLSTSLLLALLLLAFFEKKKRHIFSFGETAAWLALALGLSVFSNFNRLLALVLFQVMPDNPMHDVWGLLGLAVYVALPLFFLLKWRFISTRHRENLGGNLKLPPKFGSGHPGNKITAFRTAIFLLLLFGDNAPEHQPMFSQASVASWQLPGYKTSLTEEGILKLEKDSVLAYIKPPSGFLRASHDPRICWRGSGYEFQRVKKERLGGLEVYTAELAKDNERPLPTAWWYDNGETQTIEEWTWRWAGLLGQADGFFLVNVSGVKKEQVEAALPELRRLLSHSQPTDKFCN